MKKIKGCLCDAIALLLAMMGVVVACVLRVVLGPMRRDEEDKKRK